MKRALATGAVTLAVVAAFGLAAVRADDDDDQARDQQGLARALPSATVSLEAGIAASRQAGTPISAKFETEGGHFQLSVYTMKGEAFSEVIVDHRTGKVAKVDAITGGADLAAARTQRQALAAATRTLAEAVAEAVGGNPGYRAVSATPRLEGGRSVAEVTLLQGADSWKRATVQLARAP